MIPKFLDGVVQYNEEDRQLWLKKANGFSHKLADIHGWDDISRLSTDSKGVVNVDLVNKEHNNVSQFIADAINDKISKTRE